MQARSAIKSYLFGAEARGAKINSLGDLLVKISRAVVLAASASELVCVAPRMVTVKGG